MEHKPVFRLTAAIQSKISKRGGADWSQAEVQNTVADYFDMLRLDLLGQSYNKTEHRSHLIAKLDNRSDAAIELKHR